MIMVLNRKNRLHNHWSFIDRKLIENNLLIAGVLVIIPNYTGDRLNFGIAIEEAKQTGLTVYLSQWAD